MVGVNFADHYAIVNATLITLAPLAATAGPQAHIEASDLGLVDHGALLVEHGVITAAGTYNECRGALEHAKSRYPHFVEHDACDRVVMPGFVDAHTHALFAGSRIGDFEDLAAGRKPALGMRHTIEATRASIADQSLQATGAAHLAMMLRHGTTTAEIKSGYALTQPGELELLAIIASLGRQTALPRTVPTFCGAHALPPEFDNVDRFVDQLCTSFVPAVATQGIAWYADAFCEAGFFSPAQSERFLRACTERGMRARIHADELSASGGALVAARLRSASADHLNFITAEDVRALATSGSVAVLCPGTVDYLALERYAPARELMAAGVPVALATDYNPGTCPCLSLQMIAHLARRHMRMSAHEVIAALTLTPAYSLGLAGEIGSLTTGKRADVVVLESSDYRELGYSFGTNLVAEATVGAKAV